MKDFNIEQGLLYNDLDCLYDSESNKIDVYSSVYWTAENEEDYDRKEQLISEWSLENGLVKLNAWCDISGYNYWAIQQEEENYVSIDVVLKKPVKDYTQEEIQQISNLILESDEYFRDNLLD